MNNKERAQFWIEKAEAWLMQDPPNAEASKTALEIARELRIAEAYYARQQEEKAASRPESKSAKASTAAELLRQDLQRRREQGRFG